MKKKTDNQTDLIITADESTKKWLSAVFGCSTEEAVSVLVNVTGKNRGADGKSKKS